MLFYEEAESKGEGTAQLYRRWARWAGGPVLASVVL